MKDSLIILFFVLIGVVFLQECTTTDYKAIFTDCDQNVRKAAYFWKEPKTCEGGIGLPTSYENIDCSCILQDYEIQYTECVDGSRNKTYVKKTNCVDGVTPPQPEEGIPCECVEADYSGIYSECINNTRDLFWYWKSPKICEGGISELPDNIEDLPCDIYCLEGNYLPLGKTVCEECEKGKSSYGEGEEFNEWEEWPSTKFKTYCEYGTGQDGECDGWELKGTYIINGNPGIISSNSTLEYWDYFVTDDYNYISFTYTIDGVQNHEGLIFEIDGEVKLGLEYYQIKTKTVRFKLSKGLHKFKWVYYNDETVCNIKSYGQIEEIVAQGTEYSTSECKLCPIGWYIDQKGSTECIECGRNYYSERQYGSIICKECSDTEYSDPGSWKCNDKEPCTDQDYESYYSVCNEDSTRTKYWKLIEPVICDMTRGVTPDDKPPEPNKSCRICDPGEIKVKNRTDESSIFNYYCSACPIGSKRAIDDDQCVPCPEGTEAPRTLYFHNFEKWPKDFTTICTNECGTSGWRRNENILDSGEGHLGLVESILTYKFESEIESSFVNITFSLNCEDNSNMLLDSKCGLNFYLNDKLTFQFWSQNITTKTVQLPIHEVRENELNIKFWKRYLTSNNTNNDHAKIIQIILQGITDGGAPSCQLCPNGTYSSGATNKCIKCEPGTYNNNKGLTTCFACPENTFNDEYGSDKCLQCGFGTFSEPGSTNCYDKDCVFQFDQDLIYNLSALSTPNEMEGPINDPYGNEYYINLCYLVNSKDYCINDQGENLITHSCQKSKNKNNSIDIGNRIEILELGNDNDNNNNNNLVYLNNNKDEYYNNLVKNSIQINNFVTNIRNEGLMFRLLSGDEEGCDKQRYSNITLLCDTSIDKGKIEPVSNIENPKFSCHYEFTWRTKYACRKCTERDYNHYYTNCENDQRMKIYYWIENPKMCYGGMELPEDEQTECEGNKICHSGTYVDGEECIGCIEGRYSTGQNLFFEYEKLNDLGTIGQNLTSFITGCEGFECTCWNYSYNNLQNGIGESSWLKLIKNFKDIGKIEFNVNQYFINLNKQNLPIPRFVFKIDGKKMISNSNNFFTSKFQYQSFKFDVDSIGTHEFEWVVFNSSSPLNQIEINNITLLNVDKSKQLCTECEMGFYSADNSSANCLICPINTYNDNLGSTACSNCGIGTYSYDGFAHCKSKNDCTEDDWYIHWEDCNPEDRTRKGHYKFYQPKNCIGDLPSDGEPVIEPCLSCYPGTFLNEATNLCEICKDGEYTDIIDAKECKSSKPGYASIKSVQYTNYESNHNLILENHIQDQIETYCSGNGCGFSKGWRLRNDHLDSGFGSLVGGSFKSILNFKFKTNIIEENGSFQFSYKFNNSFDIASLTLVINNEPLFEFNSLDGASENSMWMTKNVSLDIGEYEITFVYYQLDSLKSYQKCWLKDIQFYATSAGTSKHIKSCSNGSYSPSSKSTKCLLCEPGSYSINEDSNGNDKGILECTKCPENQYNEDYGLTNCFGCGVGTWGNKELGSTDCLNDCTYSADKDQIFDFTKIVEKKPIIKIFNNERENEIIYLSLCSKIVNSLYCNEENSFVCKNLTSYGYILNFDYPLPTQKYPNQDGVVIEYLPKVPVTKDSNYIEIDQESSFKTIVYMICNQSIQDIGTPTIIQNQEVDLIEIEWHSLYGCRVCKEEDFTKIESSCVDRKKNITWAQSPDCWSNSKKNDQINIECGEVEVNSYVIYFSVSGFVLIVIIILILYRQKRKLQNKYKKIKERQKEEGNVFDDNNLFSSENESPSYNINGNPLNNNENQIVRFSESSDSQIENVPIINNIQDSD
ncbi:hypothetical protein M0813_22397 [Anaeramoeba flamelloides]|uniref:MRH domain-containing protein n=1 Tax=Anaeramoeba flamelloides TaxID=1746091 RepID=A0ABQ8YF95_9EUKA|nr:hypothetical protein M0813_22397 [Anaeramoeba flamelloides]